MKTIHSNISQNNIDNKKKNRAQIDLLRSRLSPRWRRQASDDCISGKRQQHFSDISIDRSVPDKYRSKNKLTDIATVGWEIYILPSQSSQI